MKLCNAHLVGEKKLLLPFPKGMKSLSLGELPWCPQQLELCGSGGKSPALSPRCVCRTSRRAEHCRQCMSCL